MLIMRELTGGLYFGARRTVVEPVSYTHLRALECIQYYGGIMEGVSAIFSASDRVCDMDINYIFGKDDIPNYQTYDVDQCPLCAKKVKIDAIVNSYGYSQL